MSLYATDEDSLQKTKEFLAPISVMSETKRPQCIYLSYTLERYTESTRKGEQLIDYVKSYEVEKKIHEYLFENFLEVNNNKIPWIEILINSMYTENKEDYMKIYQGIIESPVKSTDYLLYKTYHMNKYFHLSYSLVGKNHIHHINKFNPIKDWVCSLSVPGETPWKLPFNDNLYICLNVMDERYRSCY